MRNRHLCWFIIFAFPLISLASNNPTEIQQKVLGLLPAKKLAEIKFGISPEDAIKILGKPAEQEKKENSLILYFSLDGGNYDTSLKFANSKLINLTFTPEKTLLTTQDLIKYVSATAIQRAQGSESSSHGHTSGRSFWYYQDSDGLAVEVSLIKKLSIKRFVFWQAGDKRP